MKSRKLLSICTRTLAAAVFALGLHAAPAAAATYNIGALSATPYVNSAVIALPTGLPGGSFLDVYNFSVPSMAQVAASAVSLDLLLQSFNLLHISNLSLSLYNSANAPLGSWSGSPVSLDTLLGAGNYYVSVAGNADGLSGGVYMFSIAAVPEPGQWMLFAAGLGLLGVMVKRRSADRV